MVLKAVLFDFNGIIINDEPIHQKLIEQILINENLRPLPGEYRKVCLGRSDRACLTKLLEIRGRVVTESYLSNLIKQKAEAYKQQISLTELQLYPGLHDFISKLQTAQIKMAVVSGALRTEIEFVLNRIGLTGCFTTIVAGDDLRKSKPEPDGYLLAVQRLNALDPEFNLQPWECLAIEDTPAGIQAAKSAGIPVVGVANTYPMHMLQRQANLAVDYFADIELERLQQTYSQKRNQATASEC